MGERRSGRFRLGRRREPDGERATAAEVPCAPCGQQAALRPFALHATDDVEDDLVPVLVPDTAHAITGGEVVLFDPRRSTSTLLNSSAALVWASIDGTATVADIVADLTAETGAERATIDADVRDAIARFILGGIVVAPGETTGPPGDPAPPPSDEDGSALGREQRRAQRVAGLLDRRPWRLVEARRCAGAPVAIRTDSDEVAALLAPALALLPSSDGPATTVSIVDRGAGRAGRFRIYRDTTIDSVAATPADAFDALFTVLNDLAVHRTPGRLVLHAGAAERDGAVVVVAGPSGRGKSTLTAALVQRGFGYLTDEVAAISPTELDVLPYPKPVDLDRRSAELLGIKAARGDGIKGKVAVGRLGATSTGDGRVRLLVLLDDPDHPTPPAASPAQRLIELLANTFAPTFQPGTGPPEPLEALRRLGDQVPILHLGRSSIAEACRAIDEHLSSIDRAPAR